MSATLRLPLALVLLLVPVGCDKAAEPSSKAEAKSEAESKPEKGPDDPPEKEGADFATPTVQPPPAPPGSVAVPDPWLYVQSCADPFPCVELDQPKGDAHCRELQLGPHKGWRLPSKAELPRLANIEGLENLDGYHWTRSPDPENQDMVWIINPVDPDGYPSTTIKRDRKPFLIRCVREP